MRMLLHAPGLVYGYRKKVRWLLVLLYRAIIMDIISDFSLNDSTAHKFYFRYTSKRI